MELTHLLKCGCNIVEKLDNPTSGVEQDTDPAPMDDDEVVNETSMNIEGGVPHGSASESMTQDWVENLGSLDLDTLMDGDEDIKKTGTECSDEESIH